MSRIEDTMVRSNAELDRRIRQLVGALRHPVRTRNAAELTPAERRRYGFSEDFTPRPSTRRKRR